MHRHTSHPRQSLQRRNIHLLVAFDDSRSIACRFPFRVFVWRYSLNAFAGSFLSTSFLMHHPVVLLALSQAASSFVAFSVPLQWFFSVASLPHAVHSRTLPRNRSQLKAWAESSNSGLPISRESYCAGAICDLKAALKQRRLSLQPLPKLILVKVSYLNRVGSLTFL